MLFSSFADSGQVVFTGTDYITALGGFNPGADGLCIFSRQGCVSMADQSANRHPSSAAVDGGGNLWLSDLYTSDVQEIVSTNGSLLNGSSQANNQVYMHNAANGGTISIAGGIGIDATGNVWVSNLGCVATGCAPGPFILSEIVGAGVPTINPVSAQVVLNSAPGMEPAVKTSASTKAH